MVVDNPSRLKDGDWERVVCVVALGKDWQFKGWKWPTPVELFSKTLGVFIKWDNEDTPPAVLKWNVKVRSTAHAEARPPPKKKRSASLILQTTRA